MSHAVIAGIEYFLPSSTIENEDLAAAFPGWSLTSLAAKTGINTRHIASEDECASDLAFAAAMKLFASGVCRPEDIDFILLCTQSPDYSLPTTACLLQSRLGISRSAGALDINLGCSGFVYGLGLAKGLISTGQAQAILLLTADTYSKYIDPRDKTSRMIFGDGAAASFISVGCPGYSLVGPFIYGTDGRGAQNLIVPGSGMRKSSTALNGREGEANADVPRNVLHMNGNAIFQFAVSVVPGSLKELLCKAELSLNDIDLFVFHQANAYMVMELSRILEIPESKVQLALRHCANTVSSTIPIALKHAVTDGRLIGKSTLAIVGFGVGYSWAATIVHWDGS